MTQPMTFFDPPPLRYTGSKWQLADWLISHFPPHELYCEPYCGGAAVFFRKPPSKIEVINDVDGTVVNFFTVLRTRPAELHRSIELTPYARAEYELSYKPCDDPLEAARRFYILSRQSFGAYAGRKTGWRTQKNWNRGTSISGEWKRMGGLLKAADRLRDAQIENDDASEVIQRYDTPRALFYVDPPYVLSARSQGRGRKRYSFEMTDDDHRALAKVLREVKGMVILSGYDSEDNQWQRLGDGIPVDFPQRSSGHRPARTLGHPAHTREDNPDRAGATEFAAMTITFYATMSADHLRPYMADVPILLPASSWSRKNMRKPKLPPHVQHVAADSGGF